VFVRGQEVNNPVLDLCKLFGMNLLILYREKRIKINSFVEKSFPLMIQRYLCFVKRAVMALKPSVRMLEK
jgi:hypothetical protein